MRFKKILLINLYYKESGYGERLNYPPVGLGYLGQYLEIENIDYDVIDTGAGYTEEDVFKKLKAFNADLAAFSLNSICFPRSLELIKKIKEKFPEIAVLVGGPHASTRQDALLREKEAIDFVIVKEGEKPLVLLCKGEPLKNIPGLIWRAKNKTIYSNKTILMDINDFPYPKYSHFDLFKKYNSGSIGIVTSRGCPFECAFCQQSSLLGKQWRSREAKNVVNEMEYWYNHGIHNPHILDDNFCLDKKRILQIATLLEKRKLINLKITLIGGLRIQNMTEEFLEVLKKLGIRQVSFGVESGSDKILKFIGKGIVASDVDRVIEMALSKGFWVRLFFIIGFPYETKEDVLKTFDLALRHKINAARFFNLVPYEETKIMQWIKENDAKLLYSYEEYMSNFKYFQRRPIFDAKEGMTLAEKEEALQMSDEVVRQIEARQAAVDNKVN